MPLCVIVLQTRIQKRFRSCWLPFPALSRPTLTMGIHRPQRLNQRPMEKLPPSPPAQVVEVMKQAATVASVGPEARAVPPPLVQQGVAEVSGEEGPGGPVEMPWQVDRVEELKRWSNRPRWIVTGSMPA